MNFKELKERYFEYKDIIQRVENGEYNIEWEGEPLTVWRLEMMRKIVKTLDDQGFNLIARQIN